MRRSMLGLSALAVAALAMPASAGLINTVVDTTPGGATVNGGVAGGEYVGTVSGGGGGFGGPVGGGTLSVDSDASGIYLGFSGMGDISGNSIRVFFDTTAGGFADNSTISDFDDFGRGLISGLADPFTFPFPADYGFVISPAFGGFTSLFQLVAGGNGWLVAVNTGIVGDPVGESPSNGTYEFFIPYANLGLSAGDNVDFAVVYANNSTPAFVSDEGFPAPASGNPGQGAVTFNDFHRLTTIPEPASLALLGLGGLMMVARRRK